MFKWFDLISPVGLSILTSVIAIIVLLSNNPVGAKVSSVALASSFLLGGVFVYVTRWKSNRADYKVSIGKSTLSVRVGKRNNPPRGTVEQWFQSVLNFWETDGHDITGCGPGELSVEGMVTFRDEYKIELTSYDKIVRGWSVEGFAVVGIHPNMKFFEDTHYVASLFRHEVSHIILLARGVDRYKHHELFKSHGLGA